MNQCDRPANGSAHLAYTRSVVHTEQETQLSLTNRATRLEVSQGHQTGYHSIC